MEPSNDTTLRPSSYPVSRGAPERKLNVMERYNRRARIISYEPVTTTGTVRMGFEVVDDYPFTFKPGMFVGIQALIPDWGHRRSPYCIVSPPDEDGTFELLVRLVPEGPLSYYLGGLDIGDVIMFRGPTGRSMIPREEGTELILLGTGVGIGPFLSLIGHILPRGFDRPIRLYWGLRLADDLCFVDELEWRARTYDNFSYEISLTQPPPGWDGLRGRITETVPPRLETLGNKHFYLVGNGAMIEEMAEVLSDLGVPKQLIYEEHYFNFKHRPGEETLEALRRRFVARDLASPLELRKELEREYVGRNDGAGP